MELLQTSAHYRKTPEGNYRPIQKGEIWVGESCTCWFCGKVEAPTGKRLYLSADTGAVETLLLVEDVLHGVFANKVVIHNRGNHHTRLLTEGLQLGEPLHFSLEAYCWHNVPGNQKRRIMSIAESIDQYKI